MKKIVTLLFVVVCINIVNAQYYYVPHINANQNPGGLNTDLEEPGTAGWTTILSTSANPAWSAGQTIPFPFYWNGTLISGAVEVSSSGVLAFTATKNEVFVNPPSTSAALPSALVPNSSICVWGLTGTGTDDKIVTKTFGVAPNRQYWVQFNSYSSIGSTDFTYWAIVLEETSNKIYIVDQRTYNAPLQLSIGIQTNSVTAYVVSGSPTLGSYTSNTNNGAGTINTPSDNSYYEFVYGSLTPPPPFDAELSKININWPVVAPASVNISGTILNKGTSPITGIKIKYQSGVNTYTNTLTGLNIPPGDYFNPSSFNFTHTIPFNLPTAGNYPVKVWVEVTGDAKNTNDTLTATITAYSFLADKHIVFEGGTGTWCAGCPRVAVYMEQLENLHPAKSLLIDVHINDPMTNTEYAAGGTFQTIPGGRVDRKVNADPSSFLGSYANFIDDIVPCNVNVNADYNNASNNVTINVSALFGGQLNGDYRFNAVVTENNVTGTTSDYDQHNIYSGGALGAMNGAGHNWVNEPFIVPAANMSYDNVARAILGGFSGTAGSLPTTININDNLSKQYVYNVPVGYNVSNFEVIGWVTDAATGIILNGNKTAVTIPLEIEKNDGLNFGAEIYPNPVSGNKGKLALNLTEKTSVAIEVFDIVGKLIKSEEKNNLTTGMHTYELNMQGLHAGIYNVRITTEKGSIVKRVVVVSE